MFINVKLPTIVGIFTFISRINTTSESLKANKAFIFLHFRFYEQLKFHPKTPKIGFLVSICPFDDVYESCYTRDFYCNLGKGSKIL